LKALEQKLHRLNTRVRESSHYSPKAHTHRDAGRCPFHLNGIRLQIDYGLSAVTVTGYQVNRTNGLKIISRADFIIKAQPRSLLKRSMNYLSLVHFRHFRESNLYLSLRIYVRRKFIDRATPEAIADLSHRALSTLYQHCTRRDEMSPALRDSVCIHVTARRFCQEEAGKINCLPRTWHAWEQRHPRIRKETGELAPIFLTLRMGMLSLPMSGCGFPAPHIVR
jgi:hypothetical protein